MSGLHGRLGAHLGVGRWRPVQPYTLRVTQVYRREDGGWKIVHRHADQFKQRGQIRWTNNPSPVRVVPRLFGQVVHPRISAADEAP